MRSSGLRRRVNSMAPPKPTTVAANDTAETSNKLASNWKPTNEYTTVHGSVILKSKRENTFLVSDLMKPVCEHTAPTTMISAYALAESKISNMKVGPFRKNVPTLALAYRRRLSLRMFSQVLFHTFACFHKETRMKKGARICEPLEANERVCGVRYTRSPYTGWNTI